MNWVRVRRVLRLILAWSLRLVRDAAASLADAAAPPVIEDEPATFPDGPRPPGGPPAHWVERVAEAAPELLRPGPASRATPPPLSWPAPRWDRSVSDPPDALLFVHEELSTVERVGWAESPADGGLWPPYAPPAPTGPRSPGSLPPSRRVERGWAPVPDSGLPGGEPVAGPASITRPSPSAPPPSIPASDAAATPFDGPPNAINGQGVVIAELPSTKPGRAETHRAESGRLERPVDRSAVEQRPADAHLVTDVRAAGDEATGWPPPPWPEPSRRTSALTPGPVATRSHPAPELRFERSGDAWPPLPPYEPPTTTRPTVDSRALFADTPGAAPRVSTPGAHQGRPTWPTLLAEPSLPDDSSLAMRLLERQQRLDAEQQGRR